MKLKLISLSIIFTFLASCTTNESQDGQEVQGQTESILIGKALIIPDTLPLINGNYYSKEQKKISPICSVIGIYGASCPPCLLKFRFFQNLIKKDTIFFKNVNFVFFAQNELNWYFNYQVKEANKFLFPIFHDEKCLFARINKIPELAHAGTLILDKNNIIIYEGFPNENDKQTEMFVLALENIVNKYK